MKSRRLQIALLCLLLAAIAVFATAKPKPDVGYAVMSSDLEPFRWDFNAMSDHVRAVLLVSPT